MEWTASFRRTFRRWNATVEISISSTSAICFRALRSISSWMISRSRSVRCSDSASMEEPARDGEASNVFGSKVGSQPVEN